MKHLSLWAALTLSLPLLMTGCDSGTSSSPPSTEHEASETPTNRVELPPSVRNNLGITFAGVERRRVAATIRVPGSFELQPRATKEYHTLLDGQVELAVDHLERVEPGTVLYRISSWEWLEIKSRIDQAVALLEYKRRRSETAAKRLAALREANFQRADLEMESDELRGDVEKHEAELQLALDRAALVINLNASPDSPGITPANLLREIEQGEEKVFYYQTIDTFEVKATRAGVVESLAVTDGAYVEKTDLILTTINPQSVRFRALGLEGDLPTYRESPASRIAPLQAPGENLNDAVDANLDVGLATDPATRTVTLFASPREERSWIRPGASAFLEVDADATEGVVLAIPRSAVVKDGLSRIFFKRDPKNANQVIRVEADLGVDDGRWIEVKSEVGPNDEVVIDGAYELKLATAQSGPPQKGGHFHADGTFHAEDH
ncbi:MAG: hypothetical protein AAF236_07070 [Verrucomicrobiota bacterium]